MSDREMLEAAAKAAGVELMWSRIADIGPRNVETGNTWNPLTDDGDALRLAVKLGLLIDMRYLAPETMRYNQVHYWPEKDRSSKRLDFGDVESDPCASTRRAIVRAAAAMVTK